MGYDIAVASVRGGRIPIEARRVGDPLQDEFFDGLSGVLVSDSATVASIGDDFDVVCLIGGHGAVLDLLDNADLQRLIDTVHARGGVVASEVASTAGRVASLPQED